MATDTTRTRLEAPFDVVTTRDAHGNPSARPRTVADALCDHVALGVHLDTAAALVHATPRQVNDWLRTGSQAEAARLTGTRRRDLTQRQRRCLDFTIAMRAALAECESRDVRRLDALARGGIVLTTVEEKMLVTRDADGQERTEVTERKVTTRETLPDLRAIIFRLERRFPARWGPTLEVGPDLPGGGRRDRDPAADALADAARKVERAREVKARLGPAIPAVSRPADGDAA